MGRPDVVLAAACLQRLLSALSATTGHPVATGRAGRCQAAEPACLSYRKSLRCQERRMPFPLPASDAIKGREGRDKGRAPLGEVHQPLLANARLDHRRLRRQASMVTGTPTEFRSSTSIITSSMSHST